MRPAEQELYQQAFTVRVLGDAFFEATAGYWRRRAQALEDARPRSSDFNGRATTAELDARDAELAHMAALARTHADLIDSHRGNLIRRRARPRVQEAA